MGSISVVIRTKGVTMNILGSGRTTFVRAKGNASSTMVTSMWVNGNRANVMGLVINSTEKERGIQVNGETI